MLISKHRHQFKRTLTHGFFLALGLGVLASPVVIAKPPRPIPKHTAAEEKRLVSVDRNGVAIQGYDPVSYFTEKKPVKGDPAIAVTVVGATYHFSSKANKEAFEKDPARYTPAFGGYCGYGVADDHLAPVDPNVYQIVDGLLILQYNNDAMALFNRDVQGNLEKARQNWKRLVEQHGK